MTISQCCSKGQCSSGPLHPPALGTGGPHAALPQVWQLPAGPGRLHPEADSAADAQGLCLPATSMGGLWKVGHGKWLLGTTHQQKSVMFGTLSCGLQRPQ